ncbi:MAG: hypothetical protein NWQ23_13195 [Yoonia sp.]|uniref:hypothetical protein n=1 Tax=Yoonia sp. TaxID=2212373 RepID=UPI00274016EB|nr:hypothetical protein [Yoonia sp.]MDP5086371.1 hypothetical protein [Yoonia sp.]
MNLKTLLTATALCTFGAMASAQDMGELSVGVGVTNFGYSLEGEYSISPTLSVRGMIMGGFSINDEIEVEDETVDGEANLGGLALLADYYPFANPWRVSGGLFFSNSDVTGTFDSGSGTYEGEIAFENEVAPLITTGFSAEIAQGWSISGDIGVIVSSLEASSDDATPAVQADIDDINADLSDIPVFPFIGFAVSYTY